LERGLLFGIVLSLLLLCMLGSGYEIKPAKSEWTGTVYIRADGSIDPPDAPIVTSDNITYTLIDDISTDSFGIFVEKDNIIIDGAGHTIRGRKEFPDTGIYLTERSNVTIKNMVIRNFYCGIYLDNSSNNVISGNNITENCHGIRLEYSSNNSIYGNEITANVGIGIGIDDSSNITISGNNIRSNDWGISLYSSLNNTIAANNITNNWTGGGIRLEKSSNNVIYHNNFINSTPSIDEYSVNVWDSGYPSGGNYWSNYLHADLYSGPYQNKTGSDGIGDTPYVINENNVDNYPLMGIFYDFKVIIGNVMHHVKIISNSTVSDVKIGVILDHWPPHLPSGQMFIELSIRGTINTTRFCRVAIPKALLNDTYTVLMLIDHENYEEIPSYEPSEPDDTYNYLYFTYKHAEQKYNVIIVPEFSQVVILTSFASLTILAMSLKRKENKCP